MIPRSERLAMHKSAQCVILSAYVLEDSVSYRAFAYRGVFVGGCHVGHTVALAHTRVAVAHTVW